jgi:hypothetical protein
MLLELMPGIKPVLSRQDESCFRTRNQENSHTHIAAPKNEFLGGAPANPANLLIGKPHDVPRFALCICTFRWPGGAL